MAKHTISQSVWETYSAEKQTSLLKRVPDLRIIKDEAKAEVKPQRVRSPNKKDKAPYFTTLAILNATMKEHRWTKQKAMAFLSRQFYKTDEFRLIYNSVTEEDIQNLILDNPELTERSARGQLVRARYLETNPIPETKQEIEEEKADSNYKLMARRNGKWVIVRHSRAGY